MFICSNAGLKSSILFYLKIDLNSILSYLKIERQNALSIFISKVRLIFENWFF